MLIVALASAATVFAWGAEASRNWLDHPSSESLRLALWALATLTGVVLAVVRRGFGKLLGATVAAAAVLALYFRAVHSDAGDSWEFAAGVVVFVAPTLVTVLSMSAVVALLIRQRKS